FLKQLIRSAYRNLKMVVLRKWYGLKNVHSTFYISGRSIISKDLKAGPYSFIGYGCTIYRDVSIGKYTMIAPEVKIIGEDHNFHFPDKPMIFSGRPHQSKTIIG